MNEFMNKLEHHRIKRFEKKMKELKPQLLSKWYSQLDDSIHKEYEEEMAKLHNQIFDLTQQLKETRNSRDYYKGKYEGVVEMQDKVQDKLINKIEQSGTAKGQLKQEVKQLKEVVESSSDDNSEASN